MKNSGKTIVFYVVLILLFLSASYFLIGQKQQEDAKYSEIVDMFRNEQVESFEITASNVLIIQTKDKKSDDGTITEEGDEISFKLRDLGLFEQDLKPLIVKQHSEGIISSYDYEPPKEESFWISWLPFIIMAVFFGILWFFAMSSAMGGKGGKINSFGKARAKINLDGKNKVLFSDVAGADEEKEELKEVVDFLKNPRKFTELGAKIPAACFL
jgi:cell division protease FtsH